MQVQHLQKPHSPLSERLIVVVSIDDKYASDQDAQTHLYIISNSFRIILKFTGQERGRVSDGPQQQPTFFHYLNVSLSLFS